MCMITFIPGGTPIPVQGITNGSVINDDGHGWVVASGDRLVVGKSMDFQESLAGLLEARDKAGENSVAMFHSRFGTHGIEGIFNVHPFYADSAEDGVMAHNGILPTKYHPLLEDPRSDTRIFVDQYTNFVDNPNGVPSRRGAKILGNRIGLGNKLVYISVRSGQPKVRIVNAGQGIHADGVWYSNSGYLTDYSWYGIGSRARRRPMDDYDWAETEADRQQSQGWADYMDARDKETGKEVVLYEDTPCDSCGSTNLDSEIGMCNACGTCLDCHDNFAYCMCWRPSGMRAPVGIPTIG
jgi:hypothetical protein